MDNKLDVITNLFEDTSIRSVWDSTKEDYYFSVVDVIMALTDNDYQKSRNYWKWLKGKLNSEGSELVSYTNQLKMKSPKDGKYYNTDVLDTKGIFRLVESIPSPKAEPFKVWLANLGSERVDEILKDSMLWDVMVGVSRRSWACNENAVETAAEYNEKFKASDHITMPYIADENIVKAAFER